MNETILIDTPDEFTARAIPLLKEYLEKLLTLKEQIRQLWVDYQSNQMKYGANTSLIYQAEYDALMQQFNRLRPAVMQFNQQVSGMVDQGKLSPLMRAELQLRLAELESVLYQIYPFLNTYRPQ
jgi:hypothetical protein